MVTPAGTLADPRAVVLRAVLVMCAAHACFAGMQVTVKLLSADYPVTQVIWARYAFHLALVVLIFPHKLPLLFSSRRKGLQFVRALLVMLATLCSFTALAYLPVAQVSAITFVAPLVVTAMSVLFLQETVGWRRWTAIAIGFAGVILVIRPGFDMHWAAILPLGMALCYGTYQVLTRLTRDDADPVASVTYLAFVGTCITALLLPLDWVWPTWQGWALMALAGFFGGYGHLLVIRAYTGARASVIAPFMYTELLWAGLAAFFVFGDVPDLWTVLGAAVIAGTGLYVLYRERHSAST